MSQSLESTASSSEIGDESGEILSDGGSEAATWRSLSSASRVSHGDIFAVFAHDEYGGTFASEDGVEMRSLDETGGHEVTFLQEGLQSELYEVGVASSANTDADFNSEVSELSDESEPANVAFPTIDAPADDLEGVAEDDVCKVCLCRRATTRTLRPCGHAFLCPVCLSAFPPGQKCPFCRRIVESVVDADCDKPL